MPVTMCQRHETCAIATVEHGYSFGRTGTDMANVLWMLNRCAKETGIIYNVTIGTT